MDESCGLAGMEVQSSENEETSCKERKETKLMESELHVDKKPRLGEEEAAPIVVPEGDFKFEELRRFAAVKLGSQHRSKLEKAKLLQFVEGTQSWAELDTNNLEMFVLAYSAMERKSVVRGQPVELSASRIAEIFQLPSGGVSVAAVQRAKKYELQKCFSPKFSETELANKEFQFGQLLPNWRAWAELITRYLLLEEVPGKISCENLQVGMSDF